MQLKYYKARKMSNPSWSNLTISAHLLSAVSHPSVEMAKVGIKPIIPLVSLALAEVVRH